MKLLSKIINTRNRNNRRILFFSISILYTLYTRRKVKKVKQSVNFIVNNLETLKRMECENKYYWGKKMRAWKNIIYFFVLQTIKIYSGILYENKKQFISIPFLKKKKWYQKSTYYSYGNQNKKLTNANSQLKRVNCIYVDRKGILMLIKDTVKWVYRICGNRN